MSGACRRTPALVLMVTLLAAAGPRAGEAGEASASRSESYPIQGWGALEVQIPPGWRDHVRPPEGRMPTILSLQAPSGEKLLISVFPNVRRDPDFNAAAQLRSSVEESGRRLLPTAVESELVIHELSGSSQTGYFYSFTDRSLAGRTPPPGEFEVLTSGQIGAGNLRLLFTILSHSKSSAARETALRILGTAKASGG